VQEAPNVARRLLSRIHDEASARHVKAGVNLLILSEIYSLERWQGSCKNIRMKICRLLCLILFPSVPGCAQSLTFGIQGGVPGQTPLGSSNSDIPFAVGPTFGARLSSALSMQTGLLFYRMGNSNSTAVFLFPENALTLRNERWKGHAFEFPLLLRYSFFNEGRAWRPFVSAGGAVRRTSIDFRGASSTLSSTPINQFPPEDSSSLKWNLDPEAGAGISFRTGKFHMDPEVRYSYWGAGKNSVLRKNQVQFLLGFRF
jgi:hypothetical protein